MKIGNRSQSVFEKKNRSDTGFIFLLKYYKIKEVKQLQIKNISVG